MASLLMRALSYVAAGDLDSARVLVDLHAARHDGESLTLAVTALIAAHAGETQTAHQSVVAALAGGMPPCRLTAAVCGETLILLGDSARAEVLLRLVLESQGPADENGAGQAVLRAALGLVPMLKAQGRMTEVTAVLREAARLLPQEAALPRWLADHLFALGQRVQAEAEARKAVSLDPESPDAWLTLGFCLYATAPNDALQALDRAIACGADTLECWNLRGVVLGLLGREEEARAAFDTAVARDPASPLPWTNLGNFLSGRPGAREEALAAYREALARDPDCVEALNNGAQVLQADGKPEEALAYARRAAEVRPGDVVVLNTLGNIQRQANDPEGACDTLRRALDVDPDSAETHNNLGLAFYTINDRKAAETHFQRAMTLAPNTVSILENVAVFFGKTNKADSLEDVVEKVLSLDPDNIKVLVTKGVYLFNSHSYDKATETFEAALAKHPNDKSVKFSLAAAYLKSLRLVKSLRVAMDLAEDAPDHAYLNNLMGSVRCDLLDYPKALECLKKAADQDRVGHLISNYCYTLHLGDSCAKDVVAQAHRMWDERCGAGLLTPGPRHANTRDPDRPLRVGYVSDDFRYHSVAFFLYPLLCHHDRQTVQTVVYSAVMSPDGVTQKFKEEVPLWRDIATLSLPELVDQIKADGIDILVDLMGHTGDTYLPLFARKPAPVQVTYLGYPNTTGLAAMDYRLTDPIADPVGVDEDDTTETLWRLPRTFLVYQYAGNAPDIAPPPCLERDYVTFGTFNNLAKISKRLIAVWREILERVPNSRLAVKSKMLRFSEERAWIRRVFAERGLDLDRIDFLPYSKNLVEHLSRYSMIDIALDTFPYNGTTTTMEALTMGVPVVGLRGDRHSGRVGASLLTNLGLADRLLGETEADMVDKAVALANDWDTLVSLRATMRHRLETSPLMDAPSLARDVEDAYRGMWRRWCAGPETRTMVPPAPDADYSTLEDSLDSVR